jgi:hypothetical protein
VKKYPVVSKRNAVPSDIDAVQPGKPGLRRVRGDLVEPDSPHGEFLSFHYSYTEISAAGPAARVKSRRTVYENGRLVSEQFEGELGREEFDRTAAKAQRYFADHTALLLRSLFPFLR